MATDPDQQAELMRAHAQQFTDIERIGLRTWFDLDQAGHDVDADRFLNAWLMFEHFTSLMPSDPAQRTMPMLVIQFGLQLAANNELGIAQGILQADRDRKASQTGPVIVSGQP